MIRQPHLTYKMCALALVSMLAGCGSSGAGIPRLGFGYDAAAPLRFRDHGVVGRSDRLAVHDISFLSGGRRVAGFLLIPVGSVRRPAVVFVHGSGGDRSELLDPAAALALRGIVTLTLTEPSASPPAPARTGSELIRRQRDLVVADVVAVRRAVDLLSTLASVDPGRIGYLGWSAGARLGAFVAAAEPRVRALVLLSGGADPVAAFVAQAPKALRAQVRSDLGSVDPLLYIGRAHGAVLLEDGTSDEVVPHEALLNIVRAAPKGTGVRWYAAGHTLNNQAYRDAFAWLQRRLAVKRIQSS
jgi:dienelactone hydrolase